MTALLIILGYVIFILITGKIFWYIGNRNANEARYEFAYMNLATIIRDPLRPVNLKSYKEINGYFDELEELKYKNEEKTEVLMAEFLKKYEDVTDEIEREYKELMSEDEFDPSQIFAGE
jgi:hypothetical protein